MICNNCIKKDVCKHKEYLDKYCGLELNKCEYKTEGSSVKAEGSPVFPNISVTHLEKPKQPKLSREEINEKIIELSKKKEEPPKLKELVDCYICDTVDDKENMHKCSKCGKWVCSDCSIELPDFNANRDDPMATEIICTNCWDAPETVEKIYDKEGGNDGNK